MVTPHLGALLAHGNTSDVYRWGKDAVVKLLRPEIPKEWASREAQTTALVHAAGLPAPAVFDEVVVEGRAGIIFEQVEGPTMWDRMLANPAEIPQLARLLAELQAEANATPAPSGIPQLKDRLRKKVECAQLLSAAEHRTAKADLERRETDDALCHFDVHPNNVMMGRSRPVFIDWYDAAAGDPAADVVRASALMRYDAADTHLPCVDRSVIARVHDAYVAAVAQVQDVDVAALAAWESPVLAARLAEPISEAGLQATYAMWRRARSAQPSDLALQISSAIRERPKSA